MKSRPDDLVKHLALTSAVTADAITGTDSATALKDTGAEHFRAGRLSTAGSFFRNAIQARPDFAEAHNNLGTVLRKRGRPHSAIAAFQTALMLNPQSSATYGNLANLHERYGNIAQAETYYRKAIAIEPRLYHALLGLARIAAQRQRWDDALHAIDRASKIAPGNPDILHQAGVIYLNKGDLERAHQHLSEAVELAPDDPALLAALAQVLYQQQRPADAEVWAERSLALAPENSLAQNIMSRIQNPPD